MKLGTLLLRNAAISLSQLEAALRAQVLYGGRLGTNLVELGYLDVSTLAEYLAESLGAPLATQDMFDSVAPAVIEHFGAELARRYVAFPLGYLDDPPDGLAVAVVDPHDDAVLEQLSEDSGYPIAPYVAPELRIYYYLEKHYGITRKARYLRAGNPEASPPEHKERRRWQPASGIVIPPPVRIEPRNKPSVSQPAPKRGSKSRKQKPASRPRKSDLSYLDACNALDMAEHRDDIGDVLIQYTAGRFGAAVVFILRDANAIGWRVHTAPLAVTTAKTTANPAANECIEELSLPLGGVSVLQVAHDSGEIYRGDAQSAGRPVERELWSALGVTKPPKDMLVVPVLLRQRVVNLIYAHGMGGGPVDDTAAKKLAELAKRASRAYARLIQAAKLAAHTD